MRLLQIGPVGYEHATGQASLSFTPYQDRAAVVTGIRITKVSALDTWIVTTSGKEVCRFLVDTVGNQQVLGAPSASKPSNRDIFTWAEEVLRKPITFPVPNSQPFTVASLAGATANILTEYEECSTGDIKSSMCNHPMGLDFRIPIYAYKSGTIADTAEHPFDTQVAPVFVPPLFTGSQLYAGYEATIWAIWFEGGGRNTYSGSADHQSATDHLYAKINGQRLFTRVPYNVPGPTQINTDGIPSVGTASAAGSANSSFSADLERFPAFQVFRDELVPIINPGLQLTPGTTSEWGIALTGDQTGGATYAHNYLVALCDVHVKNT